MMKKIIDTAVLMITILTLFGCTLSNRENQLNDSLNQREAQVKPQPFRSIDDLQSEYDLKNLFPEFSITNVKIDQKDYYKLTSIDHNIYILVNAGQTEASIHSGEKELAFSIPHLFPTELEGAATLSLVDLTRDGKDELIYISSTGGTGAVESICHIFNLSTLEEYVIPPFVEIMKMSVTVEPCMATADDTIVYKIRLSGHEPVYGQIPINGEKEIDQYSSILSQSNNYVSLDLDRVNQRILVEIGIATEDTAPGLYLCMLKGTFLFREESNTFDIAPTYELEVIDPWLGQVIS